MDGCWSDGGLRHNFPYVQYDIAICQRFASSQLFQAWAMRGTSFARLVSENSHKIQNVCMMGVIDSFTKWRQNTWTFQEQRL